MAAPREKLLLLVFSLILFHARTLNSDAPKLRGNFTHSRHVLSKQTYEFSKGENKTERINKLRTSNLLISGDINPHPGPVNQRIGSPSVNDTVKKQRQPRFPCLSCGKGVIKVSKAVSCTLCD